MYVNIIIFTTSLNIYLLLYFRCGFQELLRVQTWPSHLGTVDCVQDRQQRGWNALSAHRPRCAITITDGESIVLTRRQAVQTRRVGTPQLGLQHSPRSAGLPSLYEPLNHNCPRQGHGPEVFNVKNHQDVFQAVAVITHISFDCGEKPWQCTY